MPLRKRSASSAPKPLKVPKAPQVWEPYLQSFQATQYTHDSLAAVVVQPPPALVALVLVQQVEQLVDGGRIGTYSHDIMYHDFLPNFLKEKFSVSLVVALGSVLSTLQY